VLVRVPDDAGNPQRASAASSADLEPTKVGDMDTDQTVTRAHAWLTAPASCPSLPPRCWSPAPSGTRSQAHLHATIRTVGKFDDEGGSSPLRL